MADDNSESGGVHPNYRRAALQRISPRWSAFLDFLAQMNLVWSFKRCTKSGLSIRQLTD
jgi:hypothetical protein